MMTASAAAYRATVVYTAINTQVVANLRQLPLQS